MLNLLSDNFLCSVIDTSEDYKSNDSDNGSIYSADISLEDYESNGSIHSANEDYESNGSIYSANISLEDYESNGSIHSANEDYESNGFIHSADISPDIWVKKENLLISAIIPGPNQPKDFNSFLRPIIDELKLLQGKFNKLYILN